MLTCAVYADVIAFLRPHAMPYMTFDRDDEADPVNRSLGHAWCEKAAENGILFHPFHNWYLTTAHTNEDIARTLDATEKAFAGL